MARKATKKTTSPINKADIELFRTLIEMHRKAHQARTRLAKKFKCDFFDLDEWAGRLGKQPTNTDEEICFAMGRLTYDY